MRKEDYQKIITDLEIHYQEFLRNSQGSEMFGDEDKRKIQTQFTDAQKHYQTLIIQLPNQPRQPQIGLLLSWLLQSLNCWVSLFQRWVMHSFYVRMFFSTYEWKYVQELFCCLRT